MREYVDYISVNIDTLQTNNNRDVLHFFNVFDLLFILGFHYEVIVDIYLKNIQYCIFLVEFCIYFIKLSLFENELLFDKLNSSEIFNTVFFI